MAVLTQLPNVQCIYSGWLDTSVTETEVLVFTKVATEDGGALVLYK